MSLSIRHHVLVAALGVLGTVGWVPRADALGIGARGSWVDRVDAEESSHMLGAFVRTGSMFGLEGAVDYRNEDLGGGAELRTWPITASVIVAPIPLVYGVAGLGWYNTTLELPASLGGTEETTRDFGFHVGAGVKMPVLPALSLVGDLRYAYVNYDADDAAVAIQALDKGNYMSVNVGAMLQIPPTP